MSKNVLFILFSALLFWPGMLTVASSDYRVIHAAAAYNDKMCIANYTNYCINQVCINSIYRDCDRRCYHGAVNKCALEEEYD